MILYNYIRYTLSVPLPQLCAIHNPKETNKNNRTSNITKAGPYMNYDADQPNTIKNQIDGKDGNTECISFLVHTRLLCKAYIETIIIIMY